MMDLFSDSEAETSATLPEDTEQMTKLYDTEPYTAFTEDLEFMWRWTIYRDKKLVQEGCSLTLDASRHAVNHVLAFFNVSTNQLRPGV